MKKGDRVYVRTDYNHKGVIAVHEYVVGSWGKKQGHLMHADGSVGARVYPNHPGQMDNLAKVEDVADLRSWAMEFGRAVIAGHRASIENAIERNADDANYVRHMRKELAAIQDEPTFLSTSDHAERFSTLGLRGLVDVPADR